MITYVKVQNLSNHQQIYNTLIIIYIIFLTLFPRKIFDSFCRLVNGGRTTEDDSITFCHRHALNTKFVMQVRITFALYSGIWL